MDTKSFLKNLKEYAKLYKKSPETSREFFSYVDGHYADYINATPDERAKIRKVIKGGIFGSKDIAHALLMYVKDRMLQRLKSTKDEIWLIRVLTAISMENFSTRFSDPSYDPSGEPTNAEYLIVDLHVTAKENDIDPSPTLSDIANISDSKGYYNMRRIMRKGGERKLVLERSENGKFIGIRY